MAVSLTCCTAGPRGLRRPLAGGKVREFLLGEGTRGGVAPLREAGTTRTDCVRTMPTIINPAGKQLRERQGPAIVSEEGRQAYGGGGRLERLPETTNAVTSVT